MSGALAVADLTLAVHGETPIPDRVHHLHYGNSHTVSSSQPLLYVPHLSGLLECLTYCMGLSDSGMVHTMAKVISCRQRSYSGKQLELKQIPR
jgi:hypothetical protein